MSVLTVICLSPDHTAVHCGAAQREPGGEEERVCQTLSGDLTLSFPLSLYSASVWHPVELSARGVKGERSKVKGEKLALGF